jgi:hypothetical protein
VKPGKPGKLNFLARASRPPECHQRRNVRFRSVPEPHSGSHAGELQSLCRRSRVHEERYQPRWCRLDQQPVSAESWRGAICCHRRRHVSNARCSAGSG